VLPGFGKLTKRKRAARTGFNVQTRQKMKVAAKTVVRFRVAKGAKDAILGTKTPSQAGQMAKQASPSAARTGGKAGPSRKGGGQGHGVAAQGSSNVPANEFGQLEHRDRVLTVEDRPELVNCHIIDPRIDNATWHAAFGCLGSRFRR
jgi:hypothetical protein